MTDEMKYTDEELFEMMKDLPDFRSFPIPVSWFKKFNIPPLEVINPRTFIESRYTLKCALAEKELTPLIVTEPTKNPDGSIKLAPVAPPEEVDVKVTTRPFELKEGELFPTVLPSIAEFGENKD